MTADHPLPPEITAAIDAHAIALLKSIVDGMYVYTLLSPKAEAA